MPDQNSTNPKAKNPKAELRRSLIHTRRSLPPETWRHQSDRLCRHLQAAPPFAQAQTLLAYLSFRQEPDLSPLFSTKQWGIPRCVGKSLLWHHWSPDALQPGAYGILEPVATAPLIDPATVDLILVPAVAIDSQGYRLGYGGGFYDRCLSHPAWSAKLTIGIVFDFALLPELPIEPWDRPLHGVCTESGLRWFRSLASDSPLI
jgi:5-formyltetrahydrofolate cyclo-ligase